MNLVYTATNSSLRSLMVAQMVKILPSFIEPKVHHNVQRFREVHLWNILSQLSPVHAFTLFLYDPLNIIIPLTTVSNVLSSLQISNQNVNGNIKFPMSWLFYNPKTLGQQTHKTQYTLTRTDILRVDSSNQFHIWDSWNVPAT